MLYVESIVLLYYIFEDPYQDENIMKIKMKIDVGAGPKTGFDVHG
jgi:hypothetical protein